MNKTTEALKLSEKACFAGKECEALLAKLCVKLGMPDLASEFLDPGVFDRAITALREALDHSGEANEMVAEQAEQEPTNLCQNTTELVEKDCGGAHHHCYPGSFGD